MRRVVVSADDFGLTEAVNEAVERAHLEGGLTQASLMVAAPAAADAVARARWLPSLAVGLHLVVVDGDSVLGHAALPRITDADGRFPRRQVALAMRYAFSGAARRELAAEIRAQFAAYAATGLVLHHADAHKHMQMHPVVARLMMQIGREFGLARVRAPAEPPERAAGLRHHSLPVGDWALFGWARLLRAWLRRTRFCHQRPGVRHQVVGADDGGAGGSAAGAAAAGRERDLFPSGGAAGRGVGRADAGVPA